MTTIKVPKALRDRLATLAKQHGSTLAGTIARVLDEADERAFWQQVTEDNAGLSDVDRQSAVRDHTLRDDLDDDVDDALAPEEW